MSKTALLGGVAASLLISLGTAFAGEMTLPELVKQDTPQAVIDEHLEALNECDWDRLMAQYPDEVEFHLVDGVLVKGREAVGELFAGFCKSREEGGLKGLTFTTISSQTVDGTINVQWSADADFLEEPHIGSDAYVTKDGLMYAQVTTFDGAKLKFKE
ncbi:MAG: nuclear transport factor 2 family protein [Geminicoccaceae bacterium]